MSYNYVYQINCLKGEYLEVFDKIELYADVHGITGEASNDSMMNLLDILSTAQKEGKPLDKVIGKDIEKFCKDYFSDYSMKDRISSWLKALYRLFWMELIIGVGELYFASSEEDFNLFRSKSDIGAYIFATLIILIIFKIVNKIVKLLMFKIKITTKTYYIITIILVAATIFCGIKYLDFGKIKIPTLAVVIVSGIYITIYYLTRMYYRLKRSGTIRKEKEIGGFKESMTEIVKKELPGVYIKKYGKLNRKRVKSGLPELTKEEYMDWMWEKREKDKKMSKIVAVIVVLFLISVIIFVAAISTIKAGIIFAIILILVETPIIRWILKGGSGNKELEELLTECKEKNITIFEYNEMQDNNYL